MARKLRMTRLDETFPLMIVRQAPQGPIDLHSHEFTELVVILSGRGVHFSGNDFYEVMAGDCFVVDGAHGYRDTEDLHLVNILFHAAKLPLPWGEARKLPGYHAFFALEPRYRKLHHFRSCLRFRPAELSRASELVDVLERELNECRPGMEFVATSLLMELIGFISRTYGEREGCRFRPLIGLGEVISFMERNYGKPVCMGDLIRCACMSESCLLRAFREATGCAPIDYLIRLRIRKSCEMLRRGIAGITDISFQVGFNDSNYFSRQFKRVMGCSPRQYRSGLSSKKNSG